MTDPILLRQELLERVGGFFRNTIRDPDRTCGVCLIANDDGELCYKCADHRARFGGRLADRVFLLTYVRGQSPGRIHQSAYTVRFYKEFPQTLRCATDMALMVRAAAVIHSDCIETAAGGPWSAVTFVPSVNRPGATHPVAALARQVGRNNQASNRLLLEPGAGFSAEPQRTVRADRFRVPDRYLDRIRGKHVLLVDDTWTTGSKLQSAAVTLHDAGANNVTALCVARWCRDVWQDHRRFLDGLTTPYDALICPTTGGSCP